MVATHIDHEIHAVMQKLRSVIIRLAGPSHLKGTLVELPPAIFDAFVATDDRRIYEIHGIKVRRGH